jgi:hypothetical protein
MASRRRHAGTRAERPVQMPKARAPLTRSRLRTTLSPPRRPFLPRRSRSSRICTRAAASSYSAGRLGGVQYAVKSNKTRSTLDFCNAYMRKTGVCMSVVSNNRREAPLVHEEVSISPMRRWYCAHISEADVEAAADSPIVYNEVIVRSK